MDTTLVTVTLLSMGMAGALSVIVWRMLRDEKQRAEIFAGHMKNINLAFLLEIVLTSSHKS